MSHSFKAMLPVFERANNVMRPNPSGVHGARQQGVALLFALVALAVVTLLGVANARNSQFQMQSASAFARYLQTDAMAENAVSCVINKVKNGEVDFGAWVSEAYTSTFQPAAVAPAQDSGVKTEADLNSAAASRSTNDSAGCIGNNVLANAADAQDEFSSADSELSGDESMAAKDMTFMCGWTIAQGNELGAFANFNVATAGSGMVNSNSGTKTLSVTVWQAFGPVPSELYDEVSGGYEYQSAGSSDVVCGV